MKHIIVLISALLLTACSNATLTKINAALDRYDNAVNNFNAAVARIDASIKLTSATLYQWCGSAKTAGQNLTTIVKGNDTAVTALDAVTGGINTYCTAPPQDLQTAIAQLTEITSQAVGVYRGARG